MRKTALILLAALSAIVGAAFPPGTAAHGGEPASASAMIAAALKSPLVVKGSASLAIIHVQKGCHVWSQGKGAASAGARIALKSGQSVTVVNKDLDQHRFLRLSGPKLALGKTMRMNDRLTLTFRQPGVYKLRTMKVESPGMPEIKTDGPDNVLALLVVVR